VETRVSSRIHDFEAGSVLHKRKRRWI